MTFPSLKTARELLDEGLIPSAISERSLKALAKTHNVGRKMGRVYVFTADDIKALICRLPCLSNSSAEKIRETGTYAGLSEDAKFTKAQALLSGKSRKKSASAAKPKRSTSQSTGNVLPLRLPTQH